MESSGMLRNSSAVMNPFLPLSNDRKRLYSAETSACVTAGCGGRRDERAVGKKVRCRAAK